MKRIVVRIGTRKSLLALAQAEIVLGRLRDRHPSVDFELVKMTTKGDRIRTASLLRTAGKGLFTKEIENALAGETIDLAVHSMKDVLTDLPDGLAIGAVLKRNSPHDALVTKSDLPLDRLPKGGVIGTSSLRRQALVRALYPHLEVEELRGNLDTRLRKVADPRSKLAGIIVAAGGLERLPQYSAVRRHLLPPEIFVPAPAQGTMCVEVRSDDRVIRDIIASLDDAKTSREVAAERALLARLGSGCQIPFGAYAKTEEGGAIRLIAALCAVDGSRVIRADAVGRADDAETIASAVETRLRDQGGAELLQRSVQE